MKTEQYLLRLAVLLYGAIPVAVSHGQELLSGPPGCGAPTEATYHVSAVIDAHTLLLDNGTEVRLVGALPPFAPPPAMRHTRKTDQTQDDGHMPPGDPQLSWLSLQKTKAALENLLRGRTVQLSMGPRRRDRYGRLLAQVHITPMGNGSLVSQSQTSATAKVAVRAPGFIWLQGYLVANGLARAYMLADTSQCLSALIELERSAMQNRLGFWRDATFRIIDSRQADTLGRLVGTYQIVEGRVIRQGRARHRLYLNFGANWRRDFTVAVKKKYWQAFDTSQLPLHALAGRRVRVRGWIEWRNGPYINAELIGQIEVLPD